MAKLDCIFQLFFFSPLFFMRDILRSCKRKKSECSSDVRLVRISHNKGEILHVTPTLVRPSDNSTITETLYI